MKIVNGIRYVVEDAKLGLGDWRVCRLNDRCYSNESFPTQEAALDALYQGNFSFFEF